MRADKEVSSCLNNCGNQNLQYLLVPSRLEAALLVLDTDRDGHIDEEEWCVSTLVGRLRRGDGVLVLDTDRDGHIDEEEWQDAIESALAAKLEARAAARAVQAKAAQKEIEEFTDSFLTAARCSSSSTRTAAGRSAFDCVEIKSQASHAMDATIRLRITQLTGRCLRRQGRDREGVRQR